MSWPATSQPVQYDKIPKFSARVDPGTGKQLVGRKGSGQKRSSPRCIAVRVPGKGNCVVFTNAARELPSEDFGEGCETAS